jgi:DNA-binding transcriptional LysR family regulator
MPATKLSLDALLVLDAIARKGSFAAAAEELHRVPSAITYTVQKLEQDLDVQLFDRSGHRARLTRAGEELLREGRHLLRAATDIECRVQRIAKGWETELRIAYNDIIPGERLCPVISEFYREGAGTRLRLSAEILEGCWDALFSGRADLVIGAPSEIPPEPGVATRPFGELEFVFAIAPNHPLAEAPEPLAVSDILQHRIVVAADSSRNLPPRSVGLSNGQDTLTVPTMQAKLETQAAGLGVGFLPINMAAPAIAAGRLVRKQVDEESPKATRMSLAWRPRDAGKGLKWWLEKLEDPSVRQAILA